MAWTRPTLWGTPLWESQAAKQVPSEESHFIIQNGSDLADRSGGVPAAADSSVDVILPKRQRGRSRSNV